MRKILEFVGANLFLLACMAPGVLVLWLSMTLTLAVFPDADRQGWPFVPAMVVSLAAIYFGTVWMWRFIDRLLRRNSDRGRG